jgi:NYN domain
MDSFEEWVKTADHFCFQQWGDKAVELGASWDSFRRTDKDAIVTDLVQGGIPIMAARDMTEIAAAEVGKSQSPLAVFWDLENMPIPTDTSGRDITTSLKSILAPHGDLVQFRGYASIGLNNIPEEKRSDLQLSGCHLVDCPHHGRKEVADKMIIVDAMLFAFQHPDGATLCFITGDVDYAYLLAALQRPQWRTIVISRGTMQSMLHVNCDMKMRWETDILQPIYGTQERNEIVGSETTGSTESRGSPANAWDIPFRPLSADEGWKDDVELLRTVVKQASQQLGTFAPLKSLIGNTLRSTNPARFPQRISIQTFLMRAIDEGIVIENGEGAVKTLCLPAHAGHPSTLLPNMKLSTTLPAKFSADDFPPKVLQAAANLPFMVLIRRMYCPNGTTVPTRAFVQSTAEWLFYMFPSQAVAIEAVSDHGWLRQGTLIDIRSSAVLNTHRLDVLYTSHHPIRPAGMINCASCAAMFPSPTGIVSAAGGGTPKYCSSECQDWIHLDSASKQQGVELVVETLEFDASYDELYCPITLLVKQVSLRHPQLCPSRRLAKLWILEAESSRQLAILVIQKTTGTNLKVVTLPKYARSHLFKNGVEDIIVNTQAEEAFVFNLLWEESTGPCVDRQIVNRRLQEAFPSTMATPESRRQVFLNAKTKELFVVAKGPFNQTVALSYVAAEAGLLLEAAPPPPNKTEATIGATRNAAAPSLVVVPTDRETRVEAASPRSSSNDDDSDQQEESDDDDDEFDLSRLVKQRS